MPGPPPKPTALKLLEGNPGKRPLNKNEPKPEVKAPKCPKWLSPGAKKEWRRIVPVLLRMRVLTEADGTHLACWCQAVSRMIEAETQLAQAGILYQPKKDGVPTGYIIQSPLISVIKGCLQTIDKFGLEFGVTPSSRVRLHADPALESKPGNKWANF